MSVQTDRKASELGGAFVELRQCFTVKICGLWGPVEPAVGESTDARQVNIQDIFKDLEREVGDVCEALRVPEDVTGFDFLEAVLTLAVAIDRARQALIALDPAMERELAAAMGRDPTDTPRMATLRRLRMMQPLRKMINDMAGFLNDLVAQP